MNKLDKKKIRKELEEKERLKKVLSLPRGLNEDISIRGIGILKVKITVLPSFENGESWDFREINGSINVYKSIIDLENMQYSPGYQLCKDGTAIAEELIEFLRRESFSVKMPSTNSAYLDGVSYSLAIQNGFGNGLTFNWGEKVPPEWDLLVSKVMGSIDDLRVCSLEEFRM